MMDLVGASWDGRILGITTNPLCTCYVRIDGKVANVSCTIPMYLNTVPRSTYLSCSMRLSKSCRYQSTSRLLMDREQPDA